MSDDLVRRLNDLAAVEGGATAGALKEAASRIKKLEAALAHIYAWYPISVSGPIKTIHEIRDHARKALDDAP